MKNVGGGRLFVFEGSDGAGKTSTVAGVADRLATRHAIDAQVFAFPGNTRGTLGSLIYRVHHAPDELSIEQLSPLSLQVLHLAAHVDSIQSGIGPALRSGRVVLLDRYWWSTWAYGLTSGIDPSLLSDIVAFERRVWGDISPTAVFLLKREPRTGSYDQLSHSRLLNSYAALASEEAKRCRVFDIDNNIPLQTTVGLVVDIVMAVLNKDAVDAGCP